LENLVQIINYTFFYHLVNICCVYFQESGIPVTGSVIDKIMKFMDTNGDGKIDISEFLLGDKRIKNISRKQIKDEQERRSNDVSYNKYSRTFQKAHIDPITNALKVDPSPTPMRQSRRPSVIRLASDPDMEAVRKFNIPL
ncbi:unnamed protein product, partial [Candidula unifasciata]